MGLKAIQQGANLIKLKRMKVMNDTHRMKYLVTNDEVEKLELLYDKMVRELNRLGEIYAHY